MFLPDREAIRARAESLGLSWPVSREQERQIVTVLLNEPAGDAEPPSQTRPAHIDADGGVVLSRSVVQTGDGYLVVIVTHHPSDRQPPAMRKEQP